MAQGNDSTRESGAYYRNKNPFVAPGRERAVGKITMTRDGSKLIHDTTVEGEHVKLVTHGLGSRNEGFLAAGQEKGIAVAPWTAVMEYD